MKKRQWQNLCEQEQVKYQKNDTIEQLAISICAKYGMATDGKSKAEILDMAIQTTKPKEEEKEELPPMPKTQPFSKEIKGEKYFYQGFFPKSLQAKRQKQQIERTEKGSKVIIEEIEGKHHVWKTIS